MQQFSKKHPRLGLFFWRSLLNEVAFGVDSSLTTPLILLRLFIGKQNS
jgi:hypothetical protein